MKYLYALSLLVLAMPVASTNKGSRQIDEYELTRIKQNYFVLGRLDREYEIMQDTLKAYPGRVEIIYAEREASLNWKHWAKALEYDIDHDVEQYNAFYKDAISLPYPGASKWETPKKSKSKSSESKD